MHEPSRAGILCVVIRNLEHLPPIDVMVGGLVETQYRAQSLGCFCTLCSAIRCVCMLQLLLEPHGCIVECHLGIRVYDADFCGLDTSVDLRVMLATKSFHGTIRIYSLTASQILHAFSRSP